MVRSLSVELHSGTVVNITAGVLRVPMMALSALLCPPGLEVPFPCIPPCSPRLQLAPCLDLCTNRHQKISVRSSVVCVPGGSVRILHFADECFGCDQRPGNAAANICAPSCSCHESLILPKRPTHQTELALLFCICQNSVFRCRTPHTAISIFLFNV